MLLMNISGARGDGIASYMLSVSQYKTYNLSTGPWTAFVIPTYGYHASDIAAMTGSTCIAAFDTATASWIFYYPGTSGPSQDFSIKCGCVYIFSNSNSHSFTINNVVAYNYYLPPVGVYTLTNAEDIPIAGGTEVRLSSPHLIFGEPKTFGRLFNPTTLTNGARVQEIYIYDSNNIWNKLETLSFDQACLRTVEDYQVFGVKLSCSSTWNPSKVDIDIFKPTAAITSPIGYSVVKEIVSIQATASDDTSYVFKDNSGIWKIAFYVDSIYLGCDYTYPYTYSWNTFPYTNAKHKVTIVAFDNVGYTFTTFTSIYVGNTIPDFYDR